MWAALNDIDDDGDLDLLTTGGGYNLGNNTIGVRFNQAAQSLATKEAATDQVATLAAVPTSTDGTTLRCLYAGPALPEAATLAIYNVVG